MNYLAIQDWNNTNIKIAVSIHNCKTQDDFTKLPEEVLKLISKSIYYRLLADLHDIKMMNEHIDVYKYGFEYFKCKPLDKIIDYEHLN